MKVGSLVRIADYGAWTGYVGLIVEYRAEVHEASGVYHRVMVDNIIKHFHERNLEVLND